MHPKTQTQTVEAKEAEPSCLPEPRPPSPCIPGTPQFWPALDCLTPHGIPPLGIFQQKTNRNANSCLPSSGLPYNESVTGAPAPTILLSPGILEKSPSLCLAGNPGPCRRRGGSNPQKGMGTPKDGASSLRQGGVHTHTHICGPDGCTPIVGGVAVFMAHNLSRPRNSGGSHGVQGRVAGMNPLVGGAAWRGDRGGHSLLLPPGGPETLLIISPGCPGGSPDRDQPQN